MSGAVANPEDVRPAPASQPRGAATPTSAPQRKVLAATGGAAVATAVATLVLWGLDPASTLPPGVREAISTLVVAVFTFLAGYFTPPGAAETAVRTEDGRTVSAVAAP